MLVDFGKLIRDRIPDKAGHLLPADLIFGAYRVRDLTHKTVGSLYEGKVIVEKTYGHAAYGCAICCGYTGAGFDPLGFDGPVGVDSPQDVTSFDACSDQLVDITGDMYGWASSDTSVATLPNPTLHTVGPGTATGSAEVTLQIFSIKENCPMRPDSRRSQSRWFRSKSRAQTWRVTRLASPFPDRVVRRVRWR